MTTKTIRIHSTVEVVPTRAVSCLVQRILVTSVRQNSIAHVPHTHRFVDLMKWLSRGNVGTPKRRPHTKSGHGNTSVKFGARIFKVNVLFPFVTRFVLYSAFRGDKRATHRLFKYYSFLFSAHQRIIVSRDILPRTMVHALKRSTLARLPLRWT